MVNKDIKIGIVSDGIQCTTGFGVVANQIVYGLHQFGYNNIFTIALGQNAGFLYNDIYPTYRPTKEMDEYWLGYVIRQERPDLLILSFESTYVNIWLNKLNAIKSEYKPKIIIYVPIEGWPIGEILINSVQMSDAAGTYMKFGSDLYMKEVGEHLPYGGFGPEHGNFTRFDYDKRQKYRELIGWDNKFVVGFVGRNKRTKQQGQMLKLARHLVDEYDMNDLLMYLHCAARDNMHGSSWSGWDVGAWIGAYELEKHVCLPLIPNQNNSLIEHNDYNDEILALIDKELAEGKLTPKEAIVARLHALNLNQIYNCMDVYVSMSQGEGFGLPQLEAMATGTPIIYLDDRGATNELVGNAGIKVPSLGFEPWGPGIEVPIPDVKAYGKIINQLYIDKKYEYSQWLLNLSDSSLERAKDFSWTNMHNLFNNLINEVFKENNESQ